MRRISAIQLPAVILLFCAIAPGLVSQTHTVQPEKTGPPQRQRQGFLDYALGKINPSNTDYGASMASSRRLSARASISGLTRVGSGCSSTRATRNGSRLTYSCTLKRCSPWQIR